MEKRFLFLAAALLIAACTTPKTPTAPAVADNAISAPTLHLGHGPTASLSDDNPHSAAHNDKGDIDGWFDGESVKLYYTKTYFCVEPPDSFATTGCEIGADAETAPRPGAHIPTIYAIAAAGGLLPPADTLACQAGSVCLNHPAMIDASRVGGSPTAQGVPHSHILSERGGGWFHTVNIRVRDINVWNQIAEAKSLAKVRELQSDPIVGVNGQKLISADTPTNIYFFIASWRPAGE